MKIQYCIYHGIQIISLNYFKNEICKILFCQLTIKLLMKK